MKKLLFLAILLVASLSAQAQGFRWGVQAGMNVSNVHFSDNYSPESRVGFHVGLKADYFITKSIYVDGSLLFSQKGAKWDSGIKDLKLKTNPGYIELPIHVGYKYSFLDDVAVFGEVGPYFGVGVCGKNKLGGEKTDYFDDDNNTKRFDAGIGIKAGLEFGNAFQLGLGYDWGLTDLYDAHKYNKARNRNFTVSLAYMF